MESDREAPLWESEPASADEARKRVRAYIEETKYRQTSELTDPWRESKYAAECDRVMPDRSHRLHCPCGRRAAPASSLCEGHSRMAMLEAHLRSIHSDPVEWAISSPTLLEEVRELRAKVDKLPRRGY